MKSRKSLIILVSSSMIMSFIYGVAVSQYQIYPYEQLRKIKQFVSPSPIPSPSVSSNYIGKISFFKEHGQDQYDAVFIGDSITDMAEWEDLFPFIKIADRGIDGDTTYGVLNRLDSIYSTNAEKVFIMIGINDFINGANVDDVFTNYEKVISKLVTSGMKVYVQSTILAGKR